MMVIDKDGNFSGWCITTKDPNAKSFLQKLSENAEKIRKQNEEKKLEQAKLEECRQADLEEKEKLQEKLQEKLNEAGGELFGDKWKGMIVMGEEDGNTAIPRARMGNREAAGLHVNIKA